MSVLTRMLARVLGEAAGLVLRVLLLMLALAFMGLLLNGTDTFGVTGGILLQILPWLAAAGMLPALVFVLWRVYQIGVWRAGGGPVCNRCGGLAVVRIWKPDAPLRCLACGTRKRRSV